MGLDMFLYKKYYVRNWNFMKPEEKHSVVVLLDGSPRKDIDSKNVSYVVVGAAQWRKANAIHGWFVDNVQDGVDDCKEYPVSLEKLKTLVDICNKVIEDPSKAGKLLPPTEGFFFGTNEIDEWYIKDLQYTIDQLQPIIDEMEKAYKDNAIMAPEVTYTSSW